MQALKKPGSLEERLVGVFEARAGRDYALLFVSPHGRELLDERKRRDEGTPDGSSPKSRTAMEALMREADKSGEIQLDLHRLSVASAVDLLDHFFEGLLMREPSEVNASAAALAMVNVFVAGLRVSSSPKA